MICAKVGFLLLVEMLNVNFDLLIHGFAFRYHDVCNIRSGLFTRLVVCQFDRRFYKGFQTSEGFFSLEARVIAAYAVLLECL